MTAACDKKPFISKREAKAKRRNNGFRSRHVYECPTCPPDTWHLTSQTAGPRWTTRRAA